MKDVEQLSEDLVNLVAKQQELYDRVQDFAGLDYSRTAEVLKVMQTNRRKINRLEEQIEKAKKQ